MNCLLWRCALITSFTRHDRLGSRVCGEEITMQLRSPSQIIMYPKKTCIIMLVAKACITGGKLSLVLVGELVGWWWEARSCSWTYLCTLGHKRQSPTKPDLLLVFLPLSLIFLRCGSLGCVSWKVTLALPSKMGWKNVGVRSRHG